MIRILLLASLVAWAAPLAAEAPARSLKVYKSPTCGCCDKWIDHLRANGLGVEAENRRDMSTVKAMNGIPQEVASCHTGFIEGYFIEGHVPAAEVKRLLAERPKIAGLAVPEMPIGSPGMEGPRPERYQVYAIGSDGTKSVWSRHGREGDPIARGHGEH